MIDLDTRIISCDGSCSPRSHMPFVSARMLDINVIPIMAHRITSLYGWHIRDGSHFCCDRCAQAANH